MKKEYIRPVARVIAEDGVYILAGSGDDPELFIRQTSDPLSKEHKGGFWDSEESENEEESGLQLYDVY